MTDLTAIAEAVDVYEPPLSEIPVGEWVAMCGMFATMTLGVITVGVVA